MSPSLASLGLTVGDAVTIGTVILGAASVIWRLGAMSATYKAQTEAQVELTKAHKEHTEDDREEFRRISERLESIHGAVATVQGQLSQIR